MCVYIDICTLFPAVCFFFFACVQVTKTKSSLPTVYYNSGKPNNKLISIPPEFTPESPYPSASFPDLTHYQSDAAYNTHQQQGDSDFPLAALKQYVSQKMTSGQRNKPKQEAVMPKDGPSPTLVREPLTPVDGMISFFLSTEASHYQCIISEITCTYILFIMSQNN